MTTLLDHLDSRPIPATTDTATITPAQRLRSTMAAARVSFTWFGVQKTLTREQKAQAAEAFDAEGQFLSAGKKLIDTSHSAFRAVTAIRGKVNGFWKGQSLPFPEPGVRLIKHDAVEAFAAQMADFRTELDDAVANLDRHYDELKQAARERLGSLYNAADYPETLVGLFGVTWDFPNVEPPDYLVQLSPGLVRGRAGQGRGPVRGGRPARRAGVPRRVRPAGRPPDRADLRRQRGRPAQGLPRFGRRQPPGVLRSVPDAQRPVSNDQLDALVAQAQRAVTGIGAQDLRDAGGLRQAVATQLSRVQTSLDAMLVERPRRRILRQAAGSGGA